MQTHEEHDNTMVPRTVGALALRLTGNAQGSFQFFSLSTGRVLSRNHATALPMPDDVIAQVHPIACQQKAHPGMVFKDRNKVLIDDDLTDNNDEDYDPMDDYSTYEDASDHGDNVDAENGAAHIAGVDDPDDPEDAPDHVPLDHEDGPDEPKDALNNPENVADINHDEGEETEDNGQDGMQAGMAGVDDPDVNKLELENVNGDMNDAIPNNDDVNNDMEELMNNNYGRRSGRYELRPRKPRDYSHLFVTRSNDQHGTIRKTNTGSNDQQGAIKKTGTPEDDQQSTILETAQMNMKQGLKMFGEAVVEAVKKEMQQLHDKKVMIAWDPSKLIPGQKREALAYLMFLKCKRGGCTDGLKQRVYTAKEDASSPTIATEAVFLTAVIDAMEQREVAVFDVPGAFMQADMDKLIHVQFTNKMMDLLLEINRDMYEPCVTLEKNERVMYVELLKALYGTLRTAHLLWEKFSSKLKEWGFEMNKYDPCIANKIVNGTQMTVAWHVDDLKVSHKMLSAIQEFAELLNKEFGKETPITKSYGRKHKSLGMSLDYSTPGEVIISMEDYIRVILQEVPSDMSSMAATPAGNCLFKVNSTNPTLLTGEKKEIFVHVVMQLLYLSQRGQPDIRTAISFLCGRLHHANMDDYKKVARVIKYLRGTIDMPLCLQGDGSGVIKWYVDASYAVHPDMKGHTGGTLSLGKGSVYSMSTKQKLVACSSTESKVIGVHDVLPQSI